MNQIPGAKIQPNSENSTLSLKDVAMSLGVSKATVLRWIQARKLEGFFRIGHKWLMRKVDFDNLINQKIINSNK
jgi:excisionase family DNA binding protein